MKKILFAYFIYTFSFLNASSFDEESLRHKFQTVRHKPTAPLVLHGALEGPESIVGGLGSVIRDLSHEMKDFQEDIITMLPYYGFLKGILPQKYQIEPLGSVEYDLFGKKVKTEVLWNSELSQILFDFAPYGSEYFDIVSGRDKIYEESCMYHRILSFNACFSQFAHLVEADILQVHERQSFLATKLMKEKYNPLRKQNNQHPIKTVATIHMLNELQSIYGPGACTDVGLQEPSEGYVNLYKMGIQNSDLITSVARGLITCFLDPAASFGLYDSFSARKNDIFGICIGINHKNFSPFNPDILGEAFCLPQTAGPHEIALSKARVKKTLKDHDLIPSYDRPLMLYVGRYSSEKGVEYLDHIATEWVRQGGQMVIMGLYTQDQSAKNAIEHMIEKSKDKQSDFSKYVRIYTDLRKDQLAPLSNTHPAQKGRLFRFGADFICMPSKVEAGALMALETISFGTPLFTSCVQGLKDMCFNYGYHHPLLNKVITKEDFNAVSFCLDHGNFHRTTHDISHNLKRAFNIVSGKEFPLEHLWKAQHRMIEQGKSFDWKAPGWSLDQYKKLYNSLQDHQKNSRNIGETVEKTCLMTSV